MSNREYLTSLWDKFCILGPPDDELHEALERCREILSKEQRKRLLALVDQYDLRCFQVSLSSFIAGYQLAAGIDRELEEEKSSTNRRTP